MKPKAIVAIVIVLILAVVVFMLNSGGPTAPAAKSYTVNLATGALAPQSGVEGGDIQAVVYSCSACAADKFVGFLRKTSDDAIAAAEEMNKQGYDTGTPEYKSVMERQAKGTMVAAYSMDSPTEDVTWVDMTQPEAQTIMTAYIKKCSSGQPRPCIPSDG